MSLEADDALVLRHALARKHVADDAAVTLLCIGDSETFVVSGPAGESPSVIRIPIGSGAAGHVPFHHDPPTALELENAIAVVEDQVMPLAKSLPRPSVLVGMGGAMGGVASVAGRAGPGRVHLALGDVELQFQQLAAVAEGGPEASSGLPSGPAFAATLLILREFMHHLDFDSVAIDAGEAA